MQDIPAIAKAARDCGALVAMDNTWATPICFRPLEHGVDISIQAGTKYLSGHSDLVIGMITTANDALFKVIADQAHAFGDVASPDDCFLALRGMRSLSVRLERQSASAMRLARWLEARPEVRRVLPSGARERSGPCPVEAGLRGRFEPVRTRAAHHRRGRGRAHGERARALQNRLVLGRIRSLVAYNRMPIPRCVVPWTETPFLLRIHVGLEDPGDLIADLEAGLVRLGA